MKAIKKILALIFIMLPVAYAAAQGFYVKAGGGYAIAITSQPLMQPFNNVQEQEGNNVVITNTQENTMGSYGAGILLHAGVGYKFSPFLGIDLSASYQFGKEYKANSRVASGTLENTQEVKQKSRGFFVSPALMFMAGTEKVRPYALVGIALASMKIKEENTISAQLRDGETKFSIEQETTGKLALGFRGGIGVDYEITPVICIYSEVMFTSMSYRPKEREITKATVDGEDMMAELTVREKKIVYVDELVERVVNGDDGVDDDEPMEELRPSLPLSSLALNIGVKIKFGND